MKNLAIIDPYKKKHISKVTEAFYDQGFTSFSLDETIIIPPLKDHTAGDLAFIHGKPLEFLNREDSHLFYRYKGQLNTGDEVEVTIDWQRRLDILEQELSRILLTIALNQLLGITPTSLSPDSLHLPLNDLSFKDLEQLEHLCNHLIQSNLPIAHDRSNEIITIGSYGKVQTQLPSLTHTGECALMSLGPIEKEEDGIRLYYRGGQRAYREFANAKALINNLSIMFNERDVAKLWRIIKGLKSQINELDKEVKNLERELDLEDISIFLEDARPVDGVNYIYKIMDDVNFKKMEKITKTISERPNYVQIYGVLNGPQAQIIVSRSSNITVDLKSILDKLSKEYDLNGTGNMFKVQANLQAIQLQSVMDKFLFTITEQIKNNRGLQ